MRHRHVLETARLRLRPLDLPDAAHLARWFSDPEIARWTHLSEDPPERQGVAAHRERLARILAAPDALEFAIEEQGRAIGHAGLLQIHPQGRAELAIALGEPAGLGQGRGREAIGALLDFAFGPRALRRVWLITDADNVRAQRCFGACGFRREGVLRGHRLRGGRPLDMWLMAVLADEHRPG